MIRMARQSSSQYRLCHKKAYAPHTRQVSGGRFSCQAQTALARIRHLDTLAKEQHGFCTPALGISPALREQAGSQCGGGREGRVDGLYLDGGDEGGREVGAKAGGQGQLADVLVFSQGAGDGLLAQQLQAGHAVLHAHHVQGWS